MKFKMKLLFADRSKDQDYDVAYVEPVGPAMRKELKKRLGEEFVLASNEGGGLIVLQVIKKILELYMAFSDSSHMRIQARKEWDEILFLMGVQKLLVDGKSSDELDDLRRSLRKLVKTESVVSKLKQALEASSKNTKKEVS